MSLRAAAVLAARISLLRLRLGLQVFPDRVAVPRPRLGSLEGQRRTKRETDCAATFSTGPISSRLQHSGLLSQRNGR